MEILYSNKDFVVCIKPVGYDSEMDVPQALKNMYSDIYPLHRLDKNVGGVMVYALNSQTARILSKQIQEGKMIKEYVAKIHGIPPKEGILEDFLFKDSKKNKVFVVKKERKGVKKAKLAYQCISHDQETSLIHIRLYTGRSHQIRVQFASRGYPLLGDHRYGSKDKNKAPLLYSCKISFPYKNEILSFESYPNWAL